MAVNLFLAHRYAAVFIILLDRTGHCWPPPQTQSPPPPPLALLQSGPDHMIKGVGWGGVAASALISTTLHTVYKAFCGLQRHNPLENNQAAYFFLLMEKREKKKVPHAQQLLIHWRQPKSPYPAPAPPPFAVSGYQGGRFYFFVGQMNLLHSQNQKKKRNTSEIRFGNDLQTSHFFSCGFRTADLCFLFIVFYFF